MLDREPNASSRLDGIGSSLTQVPSLHGHGRGTMSDRDQQTNGREPSSRTPFGSDASFDDLAQSLAATHWWGIALRGALAILFGIVFLAAPAASFAGLVFAFGAWVFLDGVWMLANAFQRRGNWLYLIEALAGIAVGILTFMSPAATALALYTFVAAWCVITGVLKLYAAVRLRTVMRNELFLVAGGVLSILFGILMVFHPAMGLFALSIWIGVFALLLGGLLVGLSLRVRKLGRAAA
jgi:uncharacterized membrane protein HdeD (DUF308 family)